MVKKNGIILSVVLFIVGILVGFSINRIPYFKMDPDVNLVELSNFIFLFFIVFAVPLFFQSKLDNQKSLKQLLISDVDGLCSELSEVNRIILDGNGVKLSQDSLNKVNYIFKKSRRRIGTINSEILKFQDEDLEGRVNLILEDVNKYWEMITGNNGIANGNVASGYIVK